VVPPGVFGFNSFYVSLYKSMKINSIITKA